MSRSTGEPKGTKTAIVVVSWLVSTAGRRRATTTTKTNETLRQGPAENKLRCGPSLTLSLSLERVVFFGLRIYGVSTLAGQTIFFFLLGSLEGFEFSLNRGGRGFLSTLFRLSLSFDRRETLGPSSLRLGGVFSSGIA